VSSDFFPLLGSTIILVFLYMYELGQISDGDRPKWGVEYRWDIKKSRFSTNIPLYLGNDRKYARSYSGKLIGISMIRAVTWCEFG